MKKLVLLLAVIASVSFFSCNKGAVCAFVADSVSVAAVADSAADSVAADSAAADSAAAPVAADSVKA